MKKFAVSIFLIGIVVAAAAIGIGIYVRDNPEVQAISEQLSQLDESDYFTILAVVGAVVGVILLTLTILRSVGRPALTMAGWLYTVLPLGLLLSFTLYVLMNLVAPRRPQNSTR